MTPTFLPMEKKAAGKPGDLLDKELKSEIPGFSHIPP